MRPAQKVDVLLVGGGVASVRCARTLRRHGFVGSILLAGDEAVLPYNRPPLSKELLRDDLPDELVLAEPAGWYRRRDIEVRLGRRVMQLERVARTALLDDGSAVAFEQVLLATGAEPRRLSLAGAERAVVLRTLDDARALNAAARPGGHAVVVGGGFIGVEVASSLAARGIAVTIVEQSDALWGSTLGPGLSSWARRELESIGVRVLTDSAAEAIGPEAVTVGGVAMPADVVVVGIGVTPRDKLARDAGLATDDGILTDSDHRASVEGFFAAGDVARVAGSRVEHWHAAREGGERAALAMLGERVPTPRAPWVFSEVAGHQLDVLGAGPWDETRRIPGPAPAFAYLRAGVVVQIAIVDAVVPTDLARSLVERGARPEELDFTA